MKSTNTGGPAFPHYGGAGWIGPGMSLRDYFAAKAMQGLLAGRFLICADPAAEHAVSKAAYQQADAMLEARNAAQ